MKILSSFLFVMTIGWAASAQQVKVVKGDISCLKGEKHLAVEFTYNNMKVGKKTEADYVSEKVKKYNEDEAGRGDKWKISWEADRSVRFEPQFVELFDKYGAKIGMQIGEEFKYKMVFNTTWTEPGFNVYVARANAQINAEILVIEVASGAEKAKISIMGCPGRTFGGYDWDTGTRIQECYALAGKSLAKYFGKMLK